MPYRWKSQGGNVQADAQIGSVFYLKPFVFSRPKMARKLPLLSPALPGASEGDSIEMSPRLRLFSFAWLLAFAFAASAHADPIGFIYNFSGAILTSPDVPTGATNPWAANQEITGYLNLSAELPTNDEWFNNSSPMTTPLVLNQLSGATAPAVSLLGYSFTDGITTYTSSNSTLGFLDLQTIGSSTIDYWSITLIGPTGPGGFLPHLYVDNTGLGTYGVEENSQGDVTEDYVGTNFGAFGAPEAVPEPATWALLGTGMLALLGFAAYSDRRRAAASL